MLLRRFLLFQAFLMWQGGFLFYTAVVIPIGTSFLQSATLQGLITQRVTDWLNLFGAAWVVLFVWDIIACRDPSRRRRMARWLGWAACAALLALLVLLHTLMDGLIDREVERVIDRRAFQRLHIGYLWVTTLHWVLATFLAWLSLRAWRAEDQGRES